MTVPPSKKNTPTDTRAAGGAGRGGLDRHLPGLRARLQQDVDRLTAQQGRERAGLANYLGSTAGDADEVDAAARRQIAEQDASDTGNTARLLVRARAALDRIRQGTYRVCEVCADPIPLARLEAIPAATMCVVCRARADRH